MGDNIMCRLVRAFARGRGDFQAWSTLQLTEAMVQSHRQLHEPGLSAVERARIEARLRRITREIEQRKLG